MTIRVATRVPPYKLREIRLTVPRYPQRIQRRISGALVYPFQDLSLEVSNS